MTDLSAHKNATPKLKARLVAVNVQLEVVADDGEQLHPIELAPMRIAASEWPHWHIDVAIADIQARLVQP